MSCHSATANQVRLVLHTAAFWLMHGVRAAIPPTNPLASCEFATIRERLIKIGARDRAHRTHPHQLPTSCPEGLLFRVRRAQPHAVWTMSRGAMCPHQPPTKADQPHTRCTVRCFTPIQPDRTAAHASLSAAKKVPP